MKIKAEQTQIVNQGFNDVVINDVAVCFEREKREKVAAEGSLRAD